jgi:hypothetical protein
MKSWFLVFALAGAVAAVACSHATTAETVPTPPRTPSAKAGPDPIAAFETIRGVLQSPRCVNCHPAGDTPLQGDDSHLHEPPILRGPQGRGVAGLSCSACHGKQNLPPSYGPHSPPGVSTDWRLPPADHRLVFWGLDSKTLCEQIKDPKRNGGKGLPELTHHMTEDALTLWGWAPGYGRKPVQVSHDEFVRAFKTWADAGMPCATRTAGNP